MTKAIHIAERLRETRQGRRYDAGGAVSSLSDDWPDDPAMLYRAAFARGQDAFLRGMPRSTCPWTRPGTIKRDGWLDGWNEEQRVHHLGAA